jgi:hypothetical protein
LGNAGFKGICIIHKGNADFASILLPVADTSGVETGGKTGNACGSKAEALISVLYTISAGLRLPLSQFSSVGYMLLYNLSDKHKVRFNDAGHILALNYGGWVLENGGKRQKSFWLVI